MATTASKASVSGIGAVVSIGSATAGAPTPDTYTPIGEVTSYKGTGKKRGVVIVTSFGSGGVARKKATVLDYGQVSITVNRVSSDAGQTALATALKSGAAFNFQLQFPLENGQTTTGDLITFSAIVTESDLDLALEKQTEINFTVDIDGETTETAGS